MLTFNTIIYGPDGQVAAENTREVKYLTGRPVEQTFIVEKPQLWSPENRLHMTQMPGRTIFQCSES